MDQAIRKRHRFRGVIKPLPQHGRADDGGFAGRILQKYRRRQGWWGFIALIFQRQSPAATTPIRQRPLWQQIVFHRQQLVIPASLHLAFLQHTSLPHAAFASAAYPAGTFTRLAGRERSRSAHRPATPGAQQFTFWRQWFITLTQQSLPEMPAIPSLPASPGAEGAPAGIPLRRQLPDSRYPADIQQHFHAALRYRWLLQPQGGRGREVPAALLASGTAGSHSRQQTFPETLMAAGPAAADRASLNLLQTVVQEMRFQQQIRTDLRRGAAGNFGTGILRHLLSLSGATGGLRAAGRFPHPAAVPDAEIAPPTAGAALQRQRSMPSQPGPFHLYRQSPGMAHLKPHAGVIEETKPIASPEEAVGKAPAAPHPPPAPAVDIQRITDQVMDELQRKLRIEKERRGLL